VIIKISTAIVPESKIASYLKYLECKEIPTLETVEGLVSVSLLRRDCVAYVELMTLTLWSCEPQALESIDSIADQVKKEYGVVDLRTRNFEVVLSREGKTPEAAKKKPTA